jgi:hypothetical protein
MKRPELNEVSLTDVMAALLTGKPSITITMSPGQWDPLLHIAYEVGHNLLEVDANDIPIRAYCKNINDSRS